MTTGYGREVSCTDELRTGRLVTGWRVVAEALYRRLITERGTLIDGAEGEIYGIDLPGFVGSTGYAGSVSSIPGLVRAEWLKDPRVAEVDARATITTASDGTSEISFWARVTLVAESAQFDTTFAVSEREVGNPEFKKAA